MNFRERIKYLRTQKGWNQEDLAKVLHVKRSAVSKYENGKLDLSTEMISKIANAFSVTVAYLMGEEKESVIIYENDYGKKLGLTQDEIKEALEFAAKMKKKG